MTVNKETLREKYSWLEDDILLSKWHNEELTEVAQAALEEELNSRGIATDKPSPEEQNDSETIANDSLVVLTSFEMPPEAHIFKNMLLAHDIPAFVKDEHIVQTDSILTIAYGGVKVVVPADYVEPALKVLEEYHDGTHEAEY